MRAISESKSVNSHPVSYDDGYEAYSVSGLSQGETDSSSTNYATINLSRGEGAETEIFYNFDLNIPTGATIDSVTCTAKCYISNTNSSRISTRQIQLYSGTTAKGTAYTVSNSTNEFSITPGTWTATELNNAKIRIHAVRGSSNTTTNYYYRFYGATLEVDYSLDTYAYTVTATSTAVNVNNVGVSSDDQPSTSQSIVNGIEVLQGGTATVIIDASDMTNVTVTDNGTDVTSQLVRHNSDTGSTYTGTPQEVEDYDGLSGSQSSYAAYCIGHTAEDPAGLQNIYSQGSGYTAYVIYSFDFSSIPANATIEDVEVKVYGKRENSANDSTHMANISLYSGTTQKGTTQRFTSTSGQTITIDDPGTWTRTELQSAKLRFEVAYYGGCIGGVSWNVTYSVPVTNPYYWTYSILSISADHTVVIADVAVGNTIYVKINGTWVESKDIMIKINGAWQSVTTVYKKVNGSWTQSTDISDMFVNNAYLKGGNV